MAFRCSCCSSCLQSSHKPRLRTSSGISWALFTHHSVTCLRRMLPSFSSMSHSQAYTQPSLNSSSHSIQVFDEGTGESTKVLRASLKQPAPMQEHVGHTTYNNFYQPCFFTPQKCVHQLDQWLISLIRRINFEIPVIVFQPFTRELLHRTWNVQVWKKRMSKCLRDSPQFLVCWTIDKKWHRRILDSQ